MEVMVGVSIVTGDVKEVMYAICLPTCTPLLLLCLSNPPEAIEFCVSLLWTILN